jgi:hypothetical protein
MPSNEKIKEKLDLLVLKKNDFNDINVPIDPINPIRNTKITLSEYEKLYYAKYKPYKTTNYNLSDDFKHIFLFWHSEHLPPMINECVKKIALQLPSWNVILLNNETVHKFIKKEDFPKNYDSVHITCIKCDWIRLYLLCHYGGLWIDISTVLNDPLVIEKMYVDINESSPIGCYKMDVNSFKYGSKIYTCIENWLIMVKSRENYILKLWIDEFEKAIELGIFEYFKKRKNNYTFSDTMISNNPYWSMFIAFQIIIQKFNITNDKFKTVDAKRDMLVFHFDDRKIYEYTYKENLKIDGETRFHIHANVDHLSSLMARYFGVKLP